MSSLKLYVVENDEDDREVCCEVLSNLPCERRVYSVAIIFLSKPGCYEQWRRLLTALLAFSQSTCPDARPFL